MPNSLKQLNAFEKVRSEQLKNLKSCQNGNLILINRVKL
jgi:hypothetical protein